MRFFQNDISNQGKTKVLENGEFTMKACAFNVTGHKIFEFKKGCFSKYIESGLKPALLWSHDTYSMPIGVITELYQDDEYLYAKSKLNLDNQYGKDAASYINFNAENGGKPLGASVGIEVDRTKTKKSSDGTKIDITETFLDEISLCVNPAIAGSQVTFSQALKTFGLEQEEVKKDSITAFKDFMLTNKDKFSMDVRVCEDLTREVFGLSQKQAQIFISDLKKIDGSLFTKPSDLVFKTVDDVLLDILK
jgi:HK97 family phage prohead protease